MHVSPKQKFQTTILLEIGLTKNVCNFILGQGPTTLPFLLKPIGTVQLLPFWVILAHTVQPCFGRSTELDLQGVNILINLDLTYHSSKASIVTKVFSRKIHLLLCFYSLSLCTNGSCAPDTCYVTCQMYHIE